MSRDFSFAEARRKAGPIHLSKEDGITVLEPNPDDGRYDSRPYSGGDQVNYVVGYGTKEHPYSYKSAASVSCHYVIVDLWYRHRLFSQAWEEFPVFIRVVDWVLALRPEGVVASDGHFTRLVPE